MKKASDEQEKRRHRRIKEKFPIKLKVHSRNRPAAYGKDEVVSLQDISAGGALLNYSRKLEIGTFVELDINIGMLSAPVKCLGKVIRVEPSAQPKTPDQPSRYNIAVRFIETTDKKEEELLNKAIEEYYSREINNK